MKYYRVGNKISTINVGGKYIYVEKTYAPNYYKGNDGRYYYGDLKNNGYLILTKEEREKERKKESEKSKQSSPPSQKSGASPANAGVGVGTTIIHFALGYLLVNALINHWRKIIKVIGLLLASLFVVFTVWIVYITISSQTPRLLNAEDYSLSLHINNSLMNAENNIWSTELEGELTNKTSDIWNKTSLAFWGKDSDGNYIRDEGGKILFRTEVYRLGPGQTAEFITDQYRSQSKEEPSFTFEIADIKIDEQKYKLQDKDAAVILE